MFFFLGYGDVYPVTKNGRFFYIVYSIIAIPLMIGLLASCGDIITGVNKKLFGVINNWVCRKKKWVKIFVLRVIFCYNWDCFCCLALELTHFSPMSHFYTP